MSPKGKQARQSQRKKAQQRLKASEQNEESDEAGNTETMNISSEQKQKKRTRENEPEDQQKEGSDAGSGHKSKKSTVEDSASHPDGNIELMDSAESSTLQGNTSPAFQGNESSPDSDENDNLNSGDKVNNSDLPKNPSQPPALAHMQWEQIKT